MNTLSETAWGRVKYEALEVRSQKTATLLKKTMLFLASIEKKYERQMVAVHSSVQTQKLCAAYYNINANVLSSSSILTDGKEDHISAHTTTTADDAVKGSNIALEDH